MVPTHKHSQSESPLGSDSDPHFTPLNWEEFSRDLRVANHFSHTIGVYNLQGCVRQGFLSRLKTVNWNESVTLPAESVRQAAQVAKPRQKSSYGWLRIFSTSSPCSWLLSLGLSSVGANRRRLLKHA